MLGTTQRIRGAMGGFFFFFFLGHVHSRRCCSRGSGTLKAAGGTSEKL